MVIVLAAALALQTPAAQPVKPEDPGAMAPQTTWSGCLQAGSTPSTYRLNLDSGSAVAGPSDPVSLGDPFVQLVPGGKVDLAGHVGKHVVVRGKELTPAEAERQAVSRPDQQEANATAAGTGGRSERHLRYVRVASVKEAPGSCN